MPEILLQYNGGNLRPYESPDKSGDWAKFFKAQTLVEKDSSRLVIKSSGISDTGLMVLHDAVEGREIVTISDINERQFVDFLKFVDLTVRYVRGQFKNGDPFLTLMHCNQSDRHTYINPYDIGQPRTNTGYNSQSVGALHIHVDVFEHDSFERINSWSDYRSNFEHRLISLMKQSSRKDSLTEEELAEVKKKVEESVWVKRKQANFRIYDRIANSIWDCKKDSYLHNFSDLFSPCMSGHLPYMKLELKQGWDSLANPKLTEAVMSLHRDLLETWDKFYEEYLRNSKGLPNSLIHPKFNYTWGIAGWGSELPYLFVKPNGDINGGVEAVGIHSFRENRELTPEEVQKRKEFSAKVTKSFIDSNESNLRVGIEGEHQLKMAS